MNDSLIPEIPDLNTAIDSLKLMITEDGSINTENIVWQYGSNFITIDSILPLNQLCSLVGYIRGSMEKIVTEKISNVFVDRRGIDTSSDII